MPHPQIFNRLQKEKSPYLLQHAANPVVWYPWGEEAFKAAAEADKPIFLSIGYSTCHWCHVMAHESFENADVADLLNKSFISIKVDREERPDVDALYMEAVQAMAGQGGWPLSVWLTPSLEPFYGGTYFPPADMHGRPSFTRVLKEIERMWRDEKSKLVENGAGLLGFLKEHDKKRQPSSVSDTQRAQARELAYKRLTQMFDSVNGGFGRAPKFPMPIYLDFLLDYYETSREANALVLVEKTVRAMAAGGLYDQLGGGFARYSTDETWTVPHFEKMLYDNAQLLSVLGRLAEKTGDPFYRRIAKETIGYLRRDLENAAGGFFAGEDADSEGREGAFYAWTLSDLRTALPDNLFSYAATYYGVTAEGNFVDPHSDVQGQNVLTDRAGEPGLTPEQKKLVREKLFTARAGRTRPARDGKVLSGWNGLALSSFATASYSDPTGETLRVAEKTAQFIRANLYDAVSGDLFKRFCDGERGGPAHQPDYAFLIQGLLDLFEASADPAWLFWADRLQERMDSHFLSKDASYYYRSSESDDIPLRLRDEFDNVLPSGNGVAYKNLLRLAHWKAKPSWREQAARLLAEAGPLLSKDPLAFLSYLGRPASTEKPLAQLVLVGKRKNSQFEMLLAAARARWPRNEAFLLFPAEDALAELANIASLGPILNEPRGSCAYVCLDQRCLAPARTVSELQERLSEAGF